MCGIGGVLYRDRERAVRREVLERMCRSILHRGPDDEGIFVDRNVGLGMRRLNVIDLVTGHQPISNEDGHIWIVFNGEIYNYRDLREELEKKGHRFATNTDTKTIVHAYEEYGIDCIENFNGMFAFAIWDRRDQTLVLARDRLGVKPLYYFLNDDCLVFGSELKSLLEVPEVPKSLDHEALDCFFTFEYVPAPLSIFKGIMKLPAGHILILKNGECSLHRYWDLRFRRLAGSEEDLGEALYDLLSDSVRLRLISDVPLGAFLSGGIDSSAIVYLMRERTGQPVKTFSIGFDDPSYNELEYARTVADQLGTEHYELNIRPDAVRLVEDLVRYLDEPFADVSIFPTYLVSRLAREHVTVVLSGDGGDELFAGYDWYIADRLARYYRRLPVVARTRWIPWAIGRIPPAARKKGFINKLKRFVEGSVLPEALQHFRWSVFLDDDGMNCLYSKQLKESLTPNMTATRWTEYLEAFQEADPLWQQQFADIKTYLADDILVKVDRMSMANSLEARTPFLDYRLVEFAAALPSELKLKGLKSKYLFKKCMSSRLPRCVVRRKKEGFRIPMKNWLKQELHPMMQDVLSPERIRRRGFFDHSYVERLKKDHLEGTVNYSHQLWSLMMFEIWHDSYLN